MMALSSLVGGGMGMSMKRRRLREERKAADEMEAHHFPGAGDRSSNSRTGFCEAVGNATFSILSKAMAYGW
jgi:hypothetical protein